MPMAERSPLVRTALEGVEAKAIPGIIRLVPQEPAAEVVGTPPQAAGATVATTQRLERVAELLEAVMNLVAAVVGVVLTLTLAATPSAVQEVAAGGSCFSPLAA